MSYSIYVGSGRTADGIGFLAGYGDEPSSHWLEVVPGQSHPPGSSIKVGVTGLASMPGRMSRIPQAPRTARQLRVSYSHYKGHPAPLTNGGLNEHGVAVRDVWSPSRAELIAMTPTDQAGPNYSDLARLVLERAKTAREGVELIGALIAEHGHCTYGGNSHMIADANEGWVVIEFAGGKGLWVAERLGPQDIRVSRPGWIGEMPLSGKAADRFLHSENFVDFAVSMGWFDPAGGEPFDVNRIYGDGFGRWEGVRWVEAELTGRAERGGGLVLQDMIWALRSERLTGDSAGYGQIVPLQGATIPELRLLWHAHVGAVAAPFVPVFLGVTAIPDEFGQHRYLSEGEAASFYGADKTGGPVPVVPQRIEATRSATAAFKRLYYLLMQGDEPLDRVTAIWSTLESRLAAQAIRVARIGKLLADAGEQELLAHHLDYFTHGELLATLDWAEALASAAEIRIRSLQGLGKPLQTRIPQQIW